MKKEVSVKAKAEVAEIDFDMSMLSDMPTAGAEDYKIPALILIQPTSKVPGNAGEIVDGGSGIVLTSVNKKLEFVPLWFWKTWKRTLYFGKDERRNLPSVQYGPENAHWRHEKRVAVDGGEELREECMNWFLMLTKDLSGGMPLLYSMRFKGWAQPEARKLATFYTNSIGFKQLPFSYVYSMTPTMQTNDKGKFYVPVINNEVTGPNEYKRIEGADLQVVANWVKIIQANKAAMTGQAESKLDAEASTEYSAPKTDRRPSTGSEEFSNQF